MRQVVLAALDKIGMSAVDLALELHSNKPPPPEIANLLPPSVLDAFTTSCLALGFYHGQPSPQPLDGGESQEEVHDTFEGYAEYADEYPPDAYARPQERYPPQAHPDDRYPPDARHDERYPPQAHPDDRYPPEARAQEHFPPEEHYSRDRAGQGPDSRGGGLWPLFGVSALQVHCCGSWKTGVLYGLCSL